jgi:ABC-type phosphate/phosphonate transport system substrate-binding protein
MYKLLFTLLSLLLFSSSFANEIKVLHMGYHLPSFNNVSQKDVKISLNFWAKELGAKTGLKLINYFYKDIDSLKADFEAGKIDSINTSLPLIASKFDINTLSSGFKPVVRGQEDGVEMLILVQAKSKFKSLKDLRGKHFIRLGNNDLEDLYINTIFQRKFHKDTKEFFQKTSTVKKYTKAIMKLFFKKADAALVSKQSFELAAELNPQIAKKLKPIYNFTIKASNGSFFKKKYSKQNIEIYRKIALSLHKTPRGKQILQVFKADYIVQNSIEDIRHIKAMQQEYKRLKNKEK